MKKTVEEARSNKQDVISVIANRYCELLENFEGKWENPVIDFRCINKFSKKCYRGFNALFLGLVSSIKNCNKYGTFKQWTEAGYKIKKGAKGIPVFFWKSYTREIEDVDVDEVINKTFLVARKYVVFNGTDIVDFKDDELPSAKFDKKEVHKIENFFSSIESGASVTRKATATAYYNLKEDIVNVPPTKNYKKLIEVCGAFAHEFAHSTGHKSRLNRDMSGKFGTPEYAQEELIAEISAGMIASKLGYAYQFDKQVLAYLKGWLKAIPEAKEKGKLLLNVCKEAQKATDWVIEHSKKNK